MEKKVTRVLQGHLDDLPPGQSKVIRVFISSTFADTYEERNFLMKNVYPKLKEFCRSKYDLDFQVVDMRWGVRDEASDDHVTSKLCIEEIENCQKVSVGPNFVAFMGQRYGYRPIPSEIPASEFQHLLEALRSVEEDTDVLTQWYLEDTNSKPSVYILQKISSHIPEYVAKNEVERNQGRQLWNTVFQSLQQKLRKAATICMNKKLIDKETLHNYYSSVTESEIQQGLLDISSSAASASGLCFVRLISDLETQLDHRLAWRFIDMTGDSLDTEAQTLLKTLRDKTLPQKIGRANIFESSVKWDTDKGINMHTHSGYLKEFGDNFYKVMVKLIEKAMTKQLKLMENELYTEVLQHAILARQRCSLFYGREDIIYSLESLLSSGPDQPIVVHGQSGCGKTSIMAVCAQKVRQWIPNGNNSVVILRFLGITPKTSGIVQTLQWLCEQIAHNYGKELTPPDSVNDLIQSFAELLKCATAQKPLVIIIDSLDQMSSAHHAHKLSWLPKELPKHVYLVLSTLPSLYQILDRLKKKVKDRNFVRIQSLGDTLGFQVIRSWLENVDRGLTTDQSSLVRNALSKCSLPLFVRLLYEEVLLWKSYVPISSLFLSFTIRDVIYDLFSRLERKHGHTFVNHTLAYITASKGGLSEMEIEDVLSLDDEVLTDVFQFHVPPVRRIPQLVVVRLKHDVASYFVNKEVDGTMVTYWYHRQFIEAAQERYLRDDRFRRATHASLAEYFSGKWYKNPKPFKYTDAQMKKLKLTSPEAEADRLVMDQPLVFVDSTSKSTASNHRFNTRKLGNLPYHLMKSDQNELLLKSCLLNYNWLKAKISTFSLQDALDDYRYMETDEICNKIVQSLNLARSTLTKNPSSLASEILARLLYINNGRKGPSNRSLFKDMLSQTIQHGAKENALVPRQQIFGEIDERVMYTLEYPNLPKNWKIVCLSPDGFTMYAVAHPNELVVWDLKSGELEKHLKLWPTEDPKMNVHHLSEDSSGQKRYCLIATCYQSKENPVTVVDLQNGDILYSVKLENHYPSAAFTDSVQLDMISDKVVMNIVRKQCCMYDLETGKSVYTFPVQADIMHVPPSKKIIAFLTVSSNSVHIYTAHDKQFVTSCTLTDSPMKVLSTLDTTLVLAKKSTTIDLWDFETAIPPKIITTLSFDKYTAEIKDMDLSHDKQFLAVVHANGVVVWNIHRNKFVQNFVIPARCIPTNLNYKSIQVKATISAGNEHVLCAFEDSLIIWPLKKKQEACVMNVASANCRVLDIVPSGNAENPIAVAITARSLAFRVLNLAKIEQARSDTWIPTLKMDSGCRYVETALENNTFVARSCDPREVWIVDALTGTKLHSNFQPYEVMRPQISPEGRHIVLMRIAVLGTPCLSVYATGTGKHITDIPVYSTGLRTYSFSQSGTYLVTHSEETPTDKVEISVWNLASGAPKHVTLDTKVGGFSYIEFVHGDRYIAAMQPYPQIHEGRDCRVRIYDMNSGTKVHESRGHTSHGMYTVNSQPFMYLIKAGPTDDDNTLCEFNLEKLAIVKEHKISPVGYCSLSTCGTYGIDTALQVFNLKKGTMIQSFGETSRTQIRQHKQTFPRISFDGRYVAWLNIIEEFVSVGDVKTGRLIGRIFTHSTPLTLRLTCDNIVCVGTDDGFIMLYSIVDSLDSMAEVCESLLKVSSKSSRKRPARKVHGNTQSSTCALL